MSDTNGIYGPQNGVNEAPGFVVVDIESEVPLTVDQLNNIAQKEIMSRFGVGADLVSVSGPTLSTDDDMDIGLENLSDQDQESVDGLTVIMDIMAGMGVQERRRTLAYLYSWVDDLNSRLDQPKVQQAEPSVNSPKFDFSKLGKNGYVL